jgi:polyhydroxybutyrate depolymerase
MKSHQKVTVGLMLMLSMGSVFFSVGKLLADQKPLIHLPFRRAFSHLHLQKAISAAPPTAPQAPVQSEVHGELVDQGLKRTYYLHTPSSYQSQHPLPLVLAFHGSGQQGQEMAEFTALNRLADQKGFMVVYPDGLNKKWNVSGLNPENNLEFVPALISHLSHLRSVDPQRIYAVGLSNGGFLLQKLACQKPSQIAAFATVAASLPVQFQANCQQQTPISLLMINGTGDDVVPWEGGSPPNVNVGRNLSIPPIPKVAEFWRSHDACNASPQVEQRPDKRVQVWRYQQCRNGSEVTLIALNGAGHIWSGGGFGQSPFIDSTEAVWDFFQRHSLVQ